MLEAALIGPSQDLSSQLQSLCTTSLVVYQSLSSYGGRYEIIRLLNLVDPKVVFLEAAVLSEALRIAKEIRAANPQTRIVGFARDCDSEQTAALKEAGVGSILLYPFTAHKIRQAVAEALESGRQHTPGTLLAFLPAKAGSGASTAALNLGGSLAGEHRGRSFSSTQTYLPVSKLCSQAASREARSSMPLGTPRHWTRGRGSHSQSGLMVLTFSRPRLPQKTLYIFFRLGTTFTC